MPNERSTTRAERFGERLSAGLRWPESAESVDTNVASSTPWPDVAKGLEIAHLVQDGGAYVRLFRQAAKEEARRSIAQQDRRPLARLPLAVKDIMAVAGQPLGAGSEVRASAPAERQDAAVVSKLRASGGIVVGLTALHEFAFGATGLNEFTGSPRNPHGVDRIPGGSSSGSAVAVAEGSAGLGIGSDTGGSVRIPAALCGVVGFKPAYGSYSTEGVLPLAPSLDHVGLLATSVGLIAAAHICLGHAGPSGVPLRSVGIIDADLEDAEPEVATRVETAVGLLRDAGVETASVDWPSFDRSFATSTAIMFSEASALHRLAMDREPHRYTRGVRARLQAGFSIDAPTYVAAKLEQTKLRQEVGRVLESLDAVLTPTVPMVAPSLTDAADPKISVRLVRNTRLGNVVGFPSMSLPVGGGTLPVGLQVTARDESTLLGISEQIERALTLS